MDRLKGNDCEEAACVTSIMLSPLEEEACSKAPLRFKGFGDGARDSAFAGTKRVSDPYIPLGQLANLRLPVKTWHEAACAPQVWC